MCNCKHNSMNSENEFFQNEAEIVNEWELLPEFEYEFISAGNDPSQESRIVALLIAQGKRGENDLTNDIFFKRHPELPRTSLSKTNPAFANLSKEWLDIRDKIVRPELRKVPVTTSVSAAPLNPNIPPVEGPLKGIIGYKCRTGKCWKGPKSADIIDNDAPWNRPGNRSAANYIAVLDYLNPGEDDSKGSGNTFTKPSENPRYRQLRNAKGGISTYCNIYVHDATRAMWASIPHWIKSPRTGKWNELNANDTVDWMKTNGVSIGWYPLKTLVTLIQQVRTSRSQTPSANLPAGIIRAVVQIATAHHDDPALLDQPSYLSQKFANLGLPTVAIAKNPGGIGHVAMIRPEDAKKGKIVSRVYIPRSAQAGKYNYNSNYLTFHHRGISDGTVQFHVHE